MVDQRVKGIWYGGGVHMVRDSLMKKADFDLGVSCCKGEGA